MNLNKHLKTYFLFFLLFLLTLPACGPDPIVPKGTVFIRYEGAVTNLNPYVAGPGGYSRYASQQIFQTLGMLDPETLELAPLLVTNLPKSRKVEDGPFAGKLAFDFEMRPEATWDDGSPITGKDYEFTLKLIYHPLLPAGIWKGYFEDLAGVEVDEANPKKFTIYTNKYYILGLESMCQVPVYPQYHYDPKGALSKIALADLINAESSKSLEEDPAQKEFATEFQDPKYGVDPKFINGSSAYRLEKLDGDRGLTLKRKAKWWGDKVANKNPLLRAFPETLEYRVVKAEDAVESMLRAQELDVALNINGQHFKEMQADPDLSALYDFKTRWTSTFSRCIFNMRSPKLEDKKVRQALAKLADYDYFINTVSAGMAERTVGPISPAKEYYAKDIKTHELDPGAARTMLAEAGWEDSNGNGIVDKMIDGKKVELELDVLYSPNSNTTEMVANSLAATMQQGGVRINLVPMDIRNITKTTREGNFEAALLAAAMFPGNAEVFPLYHSSMLAPNGDNRSGLVNAELDELLDKIRDTEDPAARTPLYVQAQEILYDETPELYLYAPEQRYIVAKKFDYVISSDRPGFNEQFFKLKETQE